MKAPLRNFIIREAAGVRQAETLVLGRGFQVTDTAGGLPEVTGLAGETVLMPSGGDDTPAIRAALADTPRVRLGPGIFNVSGTITLGPHQVLTGSGGTTVWATHWGVLFDLAGDGAGLEMMSLNGPGESAHGSVAVTAAGRSDLRFRALSVYNFQRGIELGQVRRVSITDVQLGSVQLHAVSVTGPGDQVVLSGVSVDGSSGWGLFFDSVDAVSCTGLRLHDFGAGIRVVGGRGHSFRSIRASGGATGIWIKDSGSVEVSGVHTSTSTGFRFEGTNGVLLGGSGTQEGSSTSLIVRGCRGVAVSGFTSVMYAGLTAAPPHVVVDGGSTQVMLTGVYRVNPTVPPTYEVDVASAGGRVLFAQHNFNSGRVNTGGNFTEI